MTDLQHEHEPILGDISVDDVNASANSAFADEVVLLDGKIRVMFGLYLG